MAETKPTGAKKHITGARIAQEIKQYKKDALISPLYTVCCVILEILIPYLTASIIDKGIAVGNMAHVAKIGALMAVIVSVLLGLLCGGSGVGKSETALELLKRGHRLIADDAVEVRRVSNTTLVGSAPDNIRHYMELRGVGIINVSRLFGVGSVKNTANVNFVIQLEPYDRNKVYDRIGLEEETTDVLGMRVPAATLPVQTGRNLAVIIEVATMNYRQRAMGNNSARELMEHLGLTDDIE